MPRHSPRSPSPPPGKDPFLHQKAGMEGFIRVEIADNRFTGVFYGAGLYRRSFTK